MIDSKPYQDGATFFNVVLGIRKGKDTKITISFKCLESWLVVYPTLFLDLVQPDTTIELEQI